MGGESVGLTMARLARKGDHRANRAVWLRANPGDFTPQAHQIPAI